MATALGPGVLGFLAIFAALALPCVIAQGDSPEASVPTTATVPNGPTKSKWLYPGEVVPKDTIRVIFLGTGSPNVWKDQFSTGMILQFGGSKNIMIDMGTAAIVNYYQTQIPQDSLDTIMLTHLHSDHISGLSELYCCTINRKKVLKIWGPSAPRPQFGLTSVVNGMTTFMGWDRLTKGRINPDWAATQPAGSVELHEFNYAQPYQLIYNQEGIKFYSSPQYHYDTVGAVGYRVEWNNVTLSFSGDSAPTTTFLDLAAGSDVVFHECVGAMLNFNNLEQQSKNIITNHTSTYEAGAVCNTLRPRMCVLNHLESNAYNQVNFIGEIRSTYPIPLPLIIVQDFSVIEVSPTQLHQRQFIGPHSSWSYQFSANVPNYYGIQQQGFVPSGYTTALGVTPLNPGEANKPPGYVNTTSTQFGTFGYK